MTAVAEDTDRALDPRPLEDRFIERVGELSAMWGTSGSTGRLHALLYLTPEPLNSAEIAERLHISHGSCSTGIRQLLASGVIRRVHRPGDRKAYYESTPDPWGWLRSMVRERRDAELVPELETLHELAEQLERTADGADPARRARLERSRARIETFTTFLDEVVDLVNVLLALGPERGITSKIKRAYEADGA